MKEVIKGERGREGEILDSECAGPPFPKPNEFRQEILKPLLVFWLLQGAQVILLGDTLGLVADL